MPKGRVSELHTQSQGALGMAAAGKRASEADRGAAESATLGLAVCV